MEELTRKIAEGFQCKYTVFEMGTEAELVEQAYKEAFAAGKEGGFCPAIICLEEYALEWLQEVRGQPYSQEEILASCNDKGEEILRERFQEYMEDYEVTDLEEFIGTVTKGDEIHHFMGYISFKDGTLEADTLLLELPVKNPWEIIAYLPMGGWNECPSPEDMISICKYWYGKCQAVPAVFTHDVMEFYAPLSLNGVDSLEMAKEHYAFCTDRVEQSTRTYKISELAAGLEHSEVWYFWWD